MRIILKHQRYYYYLFQLFVTLNHTSHEVLEPRNHFSEDTDEMIKMLTRTSYLIGVTQMIMMGAVIINNINHLYSTLLALLYNIVVAIYLSKHE